MRLSSLKPKWVTLQNWSSPSKFYVGLTFLCPHCSADLPEHGQERRQRLAVSFRPPIDPDDIEAKFLVPLLTTGAEWTRMAGDTFDTITLAPSINTEQHGHWHGFITNGEVT